MLYYVLAIHFLWALYAVFINKNNKWHKHVLAFTVNFILCPIAIAIAAYNEYNDMRTLF